MSYASIMVAVDDGRHAPARVRLAAELAHRIGARLVGAAACMPDYPRGYGETAVPMGMVIEEIRQAALDRLAGVEQAFRHASCLNDRSSGARNWDPRSRSLRSSRVLRTLSWPGATRMTGG